VAGGAAEHHLVLLELLDKAMLAAQMLIHLQTHIHLAVAAVLALLVQILSLIVSLALVALD
jgi:hypothetical protein